MKNLKFVVVLACMVLGMLLSQGLRAQTPTAMQVPIVIDDGVAAPLTVTVGLDPAAHYGIDAGLGEYELPIAPLEGIFDARAVDVTDDRALLPDSLGVGTNLDLRHLHATQLDQDTFRLRVQCSTEGTRLRISWPSNLASYGNGRGWKLVDLNDPDPPVAGWPIDMNKQSYVDYPTVTTGDQYFWIIVGDGAIFRSFMADSIALTKTSKGKYSTPEERKNYKDHWRYGLPNFVSGKIYGNALSVEVASDQIFESLPTIIYSGTPSKGMTPSPAVVNPATKTKKITYTFTGGTLAYGDSIVLDGVTFGTKPAKLAAQYFVAGGTKGAKCALGHSTGGVSAVLLLPMPNIHNIGTEIFWDPVKGGKALQIGLPLNSKGLYWKKWADVQKTMIKVSKAFNYRHDANPGCIDSIGGKPVKAAAKASTGMPPDKQKNVLVAEMVAAKLNIASSANGNTTGGFAGLVYDNATSPFNGFPIQEIVDSVDTYLTNCVTGTLATPQEIWDALKAINNSFSAPFDTTQWQVKLLSTGKADKYARVIVKPAVGVLHSPFHRTTTVVDPIPAYVPRVEEPIEFELMQNYPNPFNPTTRIDFTLSEDAFVTLKVYNILGQEVATLINNELYTSGSNSADFDASMFSSGVYYYRLTANDGQLQQVKKMMLVK